MKIRIATIITVILSSSCIAQTEVPVNEKLPVKKEKKENSLLKFIGRKMVGKDGGDKHFYVPYKKIPYTPKRYDLKFDEVSFKSADGTKLHGWFLPAEVGSMKAKATIVFSHGNAGNVAYHLGFAEQFIEDGYNVFLYDYRGFGKSEGKITKVGAIADAVAAFKYIEGRKDIDASKLVSIGHSLGGAKSIAALAQYHPKGLKGIVVMGAFSSYKKMALGMVGSISAGVVSDTYNPRDLVKKLPAKVPFLVIHGKLDRVVPFEHGKEIYNHANAPKKMILSEKGGHNNILHHSKSEDYQKLLKWLDATLK